MRLTPEALRRMVSGWIDNYADAWEADARTIAELRALVEKLKKFMEHTAACESEWPPYNAPCNCGFDDLRDQLAHEEADR